MASETGLTDGFGDQELGQHLEFSSIIGLTKFILEDICFFMAPTP